MSSALTPGCGPSCCNGLFTSRWCTRRSWRWAPWSPQRSYGGAAAWGAILGAYGVGALVGDVVALQLRPRRPLVIATLATMAWSLPTLALALLGPLPVVAAAAFLTGAGMSLFATLWITALQREVRPEALARVSAYDWFGSSLLIPLGFALVGPLSGAMGISAVLALAAG